MDFTPMREFMDRLTAWRIPGNSIRVCHLGKEVFRCQPRLRNICIPVLPVKSKHYIT